MVVVACLQIISLLKAASFKMTEAPVQSKDLPQALRCENRSLCFATTTSRAQEYVKSALNLLRQGSDSLKSLNTFCIPASPLNWAALEPIASLKPTQRTTLKYSFNIEVQNSLD